MRHATIHCDGAAKPTNPGPAGAGYVVEIGGSVSRRADALGWATNNEAEYEAVIRALALAADRACWSAHVLTDSRLVVMQVIGSWRINERHLVELCARVHEQRDRFKGGVILEWIPRELNGDADEQSKIGAARSEVALAQG